MRLALALGFQKVRHGLSGNGLGARLPRKNGNRSGRFLRQMLGNLKDIFIEIDGRPHSFDSSFHSSGNVKIRPTLLLSQTGNHNSGEEDRSRG